LTPIGRLEKRTSSRRSPMSAFDPKQTSAKNRPRPNCVSLIGLENAIPPTGPTSPRGCRGRKFRPVVNFEVSIPYSAADAKNSKDGGRKKAAAGEHACPVGSTVALVRRPNRSTRKSACGAGRKQSRRFPHLGRRLCYVPANFKLFALASHTLATKQG
jgi:hypothetical protein